MLLSIIRWFEIRNFRYFNGIRKHRVHSKTPISSTLNNRVAIGISGQRLVGTSDFVYPPILEASLTEHEQAELDESKRHPEDLDPNVQ